MLQETKINCQCKNIFWSRFPWLCNFEARKSFQLYTFSVCIVPSVQKGYMFKLEKSLGCGDNEPDLRQDPLEAILVIFGRRALIFFSDERSMPICLYTAHWKSSGMVSFKRFKLVCSSSMITDHFSDHWSLQWSLITSVITEEEQTSLKRLKETIPELFQCAVVRQMGIDLII